jgi:hypothetical protein
MHRYQEPVAKAPLFSPRITASGRSTGFPTTARPGIRWSGDSYEYWLSIAPPGCLPGRQHIRPEDLVPILSRLWLLDVFRNPLRFRYRLVGTDITRSVQREMTGLWLDEVQPGSVLNVNMRDRYRYIAETARPTWRRGPTYWQRDPTHRIVENCVLPLATDGETVDKIVAVSVMFDAGGREF